MPPKRKGTSKKPPKARTPTLIDGLTKEEMSKEQLEEVIVRLREQLDREREERNYFQLERDKINAFREITARELEEAKAQQKNLVKDMEEEERHHEVKIKVYKQKMKHLLCEHQNTIAELKADGFVSMEMMQEEQKQLETELHNKMRAITADMQELDYENLDKELELKHDEAMTTTTNNWEKQLTEIRAENEKKLQSLQKELNNLTRDVTSEKEYQWNSHIIALKDDHNNALSEANAIVTDMQEDLNAINALKKEIKDMKAKQKEMEKDLALVSQDNKRLDERISEINEENFKIEKKTKHFPLKRDASDEAKKKALKDLKEAHEALEQKFSQLQLEKDELYKTLAQNIQKAQHGGDQECPLLERKLRDVTDSVEKTEAQLCSVLSASNMDQTALSAVTNKIVENLESKNTSIKNLQYKKNLISKARRDLLLAVEEKQRALGVPVEEF